MKNRISIVLDPQDVADFNAAQATQKRILLKWLSGVDLDEVAPGNYMGTEGGWRYCQDGFEFATEYPKIYDDEELNYDEYKKDIDAATFAIDAKKGSDETNTRLGIVLILVGKDLMEETHYIRGRGNAKRRLNLDYIAPSDKLNALFEKRTEKADETRKANEALKDLKDQLAKATKST